MNLSYIQYIDTYSASLELMTLIFYCTICYCFLFLPLVFRSFGEDAKLVIILSKERCEEKKLGKVQWKVFS